MIPCLDESGVHEVAHDNGERHLLRMVSYIAGRPLADLGTAGSELKRQIGQALGHLDAAAANLRPVIALSTDGPIHNVIKIKPPLVLGAADIDATLEELEEVLVVISHAG